MIKTIILEQGVVQAVQYLYKSYKYQKSNSTLEMGNLQKVLNGKLNNYNHKSTCSGHMI